MARVIKQNILFLVMLLIVLINTTLVNAATEDTEYTDPSANKKCTVFADMSLRYSVKIPKLITLDSKSKSADYKVVSWADLDASYCINVTPSSDTVELVQPHKESIEATIVQDKTTFRAYNYINDLDDTESLALKPGTDEAEAVQNNVITGKVSVSNISAGTWSGKFNFNIALDEVSASSSTHTLYLEYEDCEDIMGFGEDTDLILTVEDALQRDDITVSFKEQLSTSLPDGYEADILIGGVDYDTYAVIDGTVWYDCYIKRLSDDVTIYLLAYIDSYMEDRILVHVGNNDTLTINGEEVETYNGIAYINKDDLKSIDDLGLDSYTESFDTIIENSMHIRSTDKNGNYKEMYVMRWDVG